MVWGEANWYFGSFRQGFSAHKKLNKNIPQMSSTLHKPPMHVLLISIDGFSEFSRGKGWEGHTDILGGRITVVRDYCKIHLQAKD